MTARKLIKSDRYIAFKPFPISASEAEIIAHKYDETNVSDWTFRRPILNSLPNRYSVPVAHLYNEIYAKDGRRLANLFLLDTKESLTQFSIRLSSSYDELVNHANSVASECSYQRLRYANNQKSLDYLTGYIRTRYGLNIEKLFKLVITRYTRQSTTSTL